MNQVQINNKTISVKWSVSVENELFVDIYRYGGKIKSVTCADTLIYTADEQGVYRFIAHKEKDGKRYPVSHQIVELFDDETKAKYEMFKTDKISNIIYPLDYYPYIKPFQDIAICINTGKLDYAKDEELRNYYISKYDGKISLISSEKPVEIDGGFVLFSGYMFCNKKLIMGNDEVLAEDCLTTNLEGCYSRVVVYKDEIRLDSDYFNMHTFYYFEQGDTVIICNHYHMLIKLLHMIGDIHLTVRQNYISDIMAGFCGVNEYPFDNFTLFNEIQTISVNDRIEIINGRIERRKSELYNDLNREKPFFSEQLYQKAVKEAAQSIVNTIQIIERDTRIKKVSVDLTGGVDSRCVFAALSRLEDKQKFKYYNGSRYQDKEFTIPVMLADRIGVPFDFARCESNSTEEFRQFVRKKMSLSMHKLIDAHVLLQEYGVDNKKVCLNGGDAGFRGSYINDILFKGYDFIDNFEILRENFKEKDKEFIKIILSKFAICSVEDVEVLNEDFLSALEEFTGSDYEKAEKLYFNRARYHYSPIRDGGYGILQISPLLNRNIVRLFYGTFGRIDTYKVEFDVLFSLNSLLGIHEYKNKQYNSYVLKKYSAYTKTLIPDTKDLTRFMEQKAAYDAEKKSAYKFASRLNAVRNKNIASKSTDLKQWSIELIHYIINVVQDEKVAETLFYLWFFLSEKLPDVVPEVHNWAVYCMFIRLANIAYQIREVEEKI